MHNKIVCFVYHHRFIVCDISTELSSWREGVNNESHEVTFVTNTPSCLFDGRTLALLKFIVLLKFINKILLPTGS